MDLILLQCLEQDNVSDLRKAVDKIHDSSFLPSLAFEAVIHKSYACLEHIIQYDKFYPYAVLNVSGVALPLFHHAIRLGDLHAVKIFLDHGINPFVCAGSCLMAESTATSCPTYCLDAVRFGLKGAMDSTRRNSIELLLQTHLFAQVRVIVKACEKQDARELLKLLPSGTRLSCTFSVFAGYTPRVWNTSSFKAALTIMTKHNNNSTDSTGVSAVDLLANSPSASVLSALTSLLADTNSTWQSLASAGLRTQMIASVLALGSGGLRLSRRLVSLTSAQLERAKEVVSTAASAVSNSWTADNEVVVKNSMEYNLLSERQLVTWTRSRLQHLLWLYVDVCR